MGWGGRGVLVATVPETDLPMILKEQTHEIHQKKGSNRLWKTENTIHEPEVMMWDGEGGEY